MSPTQFKQRSTRHRGITSRNDFILTNADLPKSKFQVRYYQVCLKMSKWCWCRCRWCRCTIIFWLDICLGLSNNRFLRSTSAGRTTSTWKSSSFYTSCILKFDCKLCSLETWLLQCRLSPSVFIVMIPEVFALHDADAGAGRDRVPRLSCCKPESVSTATFQSRIKFWRRPFILCVRSFFQSISNVIESCMLDKSEWVEKSLINCCQFQLVASFFIVARNLSFFSIGKISFTPFIDLSSDYVQCIVGCVCGYWNRARTCFDSSFNSR